MTDCIAIIPARGGSRRIPRKNIRDFFGRPIICYSIETAQGACERVIVSTEDAEIAQLAKDLGCEVHQRSFELARDEVGTQAVVANVLQDKKIKQGRVLVLYPCAPLVEGRDLDEALLDHRNYAVAVGSEPLRDAGAFYAGNAREFRELVPLYNRNTRLVVLPEERVCDINEPADWMGAETKYARLHGLTDPWAPVPDDSPISGPRLSRLGAVGIEHGATLVIP